jgi:short-subunit dehydrogenase
MDPAGKYALVTGASSGIGWQISVQLARRGCHIIAVSNQPSRLLDLKSELESAFQVQVFTLDRDLAREDAAEKVFRTCEEQGLRVDILVNNAGMLVYGEMVETESERARSILRLHVTTPAMLCRLFGEKMKRRGSGYIMNLSSISAVMPYPTISMYGPTKAFIRHFTRAIRSELRPFGICVTCLLPGATDTPLNREQPFNVNRGKRLGIVKRPELVAAAGVKALFRDRPVCIPGVLNRIIVYTLPLLPPLLIYRIYLRTLRKSGRDQKDFNISSDS